MYLDITPFPIFRDRAITLLSMTPPAFDERELKRDIEAEGLLVWGSGNGTFDLDASGDGRGNRNKNSVRDSRGWEAAEWFSRKWRLLVEESGLDGQSKWWRGMRREEC